MKAVCDKGCNAEYEVEFKEEQISKGVRKLFFECDKCGEKYTAYYHNREIRKLQQIMRITKDIKLAERTRAKIKKEMDRLKIKYEGYN